MYGVVSSPWAGHCQTTCISGMAWATATRLRPKGCEALSASGASVATINFPLLEFKFSQTFGGHTAFHCHSNVLINPDVVTTHVGTVPTHLHKRFPWTLHTGRISDVHRTHTARTLAHLRNGYQPTVGSAAPRPSSTTNPVSFKRLHRALKPEQLLSSLLKLSRTCAPSPSFLECSSRTSSHECHW